MKARTPDQTAASITWGVELETRVPIASGIAVGGYHSRMPLLWNGWKCERDGSIRTDNATQMPCEFVSPILKGDAGVNTLIDFVAAANAVGATVNDSCGCHITVGIESIIGTTDLKAVGEFIRALAHVSRWHAYAIYGQTGAGRHLNNYSHPLFPQTGALMKKVVTSEQERLKAEAADHCGRGMVNFKKAFQRDATGKFIGVVEFRAFAGTLNIKKLLHHLATVLGLCRRAATLKVLGGFEKNKTQAARTGSATEALRFLHEFLGWTGTARPVTLGVFAGLSRHMDSASREAARLCAQFDSRFPNANL